MDTKTFGHHRINLFFDCSPWMSTFGIDLLHASPPSFYLFSISAPSASPHLARPLPARHTIFGITPFCQAASQWHQLSPLPFQHPLLSAAQSWSIYPPSNWSFSQTTQAKGKGGGGVKRCQPASQRTSQPACHPNKAPFLQSAVKPICWRQH